jgi:hypothetical protein
MKRPAMLNSDSRPTKPAAEAGVDPVGKKSWIIGAACSRMPMPAVTLQNSTIHRHQNCRVLMALSAETLAVVIILLPRSPSGVQPSGRQPAGGIRIVKTPNIMKTR